LLYNEEVTFPQRHIYMWLHYPYMEKHEMK